MVGTHIDINEKKDQEKQITHQAHYDHLTNLLNRFLAMDRLSQLLKSPTATTAWWLHCSWIWTASNASMTPWGIQRVTALVQAASRLQNAVRESDSVVAWAVMSRHPHA